MGLGGLLRAVRAPVAPAAVVPTPSAGPDPSSEWDRAAGPRPELRRVVPPASTAPGVDWMLGHLPESVRRAGAAAGAGAALLILTGVLVVTSAPFLGLTGSDWRALAGVCVVMVVLVVVSLRLPWRRWSPWWTLAFPIAGLGVLAGLGLTTTAIAAAYLGVIPLWFLYTGLFFRVRAGAILVPFAWATYVAMVDLVSTSLVVRLAIYGAVWFALSSVLAVMSSQQQLATEHLEIASHTDSLTGVGNRRGLELRLAELSAGDCVVICDLDLFKSINDAFGHAAGDEVLAQFGATVNQHIRRRDYAARYGGEEFVLVLVRTTSEQAIAALASLRAEWLDLGAGVTFSAGIAVVDGDRAPAEVLAAADAALFDAKAAGRDCFRVAPPASSTL